MPAKTVAILAAGLLTWMATDGLGEQSARNGMCEPSNHDTFKHEIQLNMKIEIWSDVMCPFCYIGKRNFEAALAQLPDRGRVTVEWKSFQLDPTLPEGPDPSQNVYQFVASRKGVSYEQSVEMHQHVSRMAQDAGLDYQFDKVKVTNSLKAHRLIQMAKMKGLGEEAEERLFHAYFTEGKDLSDERVLVTLGIDIGLTSAEVQDALTNPVFQQRAEAEGAEAYQLGAKGVPFFVIDRKYGIAGAQPGPEILNILQTAYAEWKQEHPGSLQVVEGASCTPGNDCTP